MNKKYNLKLDLQFRCNNSTMKFDEFDNNTSDFFIRVTRAGELIDISKAIVTLVVIKPDNSVDAQFVDIDSNRAYCDLKPTMKNLVGKYEAIASITVDGETVNTGIDNPIIYEVTENKFLRQLNQKVVTEERFTLLTDMINRLSTIEISEEQRVINEAERILSEENRKIEEAKRVEVELIRQHEEADRTKYDAIRESNENIRKINEETRISSENVRLENEANRIEQEANRVKAEQLRKDNYNLMTEDEERRRSEANAHKEAETLRVSAENTRVNEEAKRRTTEQARVSAENTRKANEVTRIESEKQRVDAENLRKEKIIEIQSDYDSLKKVIIDENASANLQNQINQTNSQLEHKANETDLDVERKRIDVFTSLSEGSTTGDAELIDVRIGYDGTIHSNAGTSIRSQVKEANENINNKIKKSINLLDNSKWIKGYYVSQQIVDGVKKLVKTEHDDFSYIEIQVKANTSYTVSKYAHQIAFGAYVEGEFVLRTAIGTGQTVNESFTFETYTTDTTIYINKRNSQKFVMLIEGRECPKYFIECGNEVIRDIDKPLEWHIGVGKDFETFTECIRFLKDDEREKTIYIHQGDYDIFNELGGSFYAKSFTQDDTNNLDDIVDWIPPNTNIIGIGKVRLIYTPLEQNTNKYASRIFSTINTRGTCTIDNIEIRCKNGRYCIHDETGSDDRFTGAIKRFKNLKCIHLASDDSVASMHQCVGGGLHKSMFIEYENCYFESHHPKY